MKILRHTKNKENHNLNEKRQPTEGNDKLNWQLEVWGKNFGAAIIKMLQ